MGIMTRADIEKVLEKEPLLTANGVGGSAFSRHKTRDERLKEFQEDQDWLLRSEVMCSLCCEWLADKVKIKTINTRHTSYRYKHMVEHASNRYITNGAFIAAAIHLGFNYKKYRNSPNVTINISEKSVKEAWDPDALYV